MSYPPMIEYNGAVQHPAQAFFDGELKKGSVQTNNLGLPIVMSGGFALTYTVTTPTRKCAVRCFHRDIPSLEKKYEMISKKLRSLHSDYFVNFEFQDPGVKVLQRNYPIVKMDWVEGSRLDVWLDSKQSNSADLEKAKMQFRAISSFLEKEGMAHGDIQNGNVMMASNGPRLIDYDGMFVPGMAQGNGSETGHKHFQHPRRSASDFGPKMDRFSFIALDLSIAAIIEDKSLYSKFREGGETIVFTANDFADPPNSPIFQILFKNSKLKDAARNFAAVCEADIGSVPTLEDFLNARNIPATKARVDVRAPTAPKTVTYISPFPVINALDFSAAERHVGDKIELIGQIVEVKADVGRRGKGKNKPYVFVNFGPWRGQIVKISIWSEGLAKLSEQPSKSWIGRWVSVIGLMDPPYSNRRFGYTHLSVTVQENGQIQWLDEQQAQFRLGKRANKSTVGTGTSGTFASGAFKGTKTGPTIGTRTNKDILKKYGTRPSQSPPTSPSPQISPGIAKHSRQSFLSKVPRWAWVVGFILLLYWLTHSSGPEPNRRSFVPTSPPLSTSRVDQIPRRPDVLQDKSTASKWTPIPNVAPTVQPTNPAIDSGHNAGTSKYPEAAAPKPVLPPPAMQDAVPLPPAIEIGRVGPLGSQPTDPDRLGDTASGQLLSIARASDVQIIQRRLSELGFYSGSANGVWGAQTQQALMDFQLINKMRAEPTLNQEIQTRLLSSAAIRASATSATTYTGDWGTDASQCQADEDAHTVIALKQAEAFGVTCYFNSIQRETAAWRIQAKCGDGTDTWTAHIRLLRSENRLIWSSERGTTEYIRCDIRRP